MHVRSGASGIEKRKVCTARKEDRTEPAVSEGGLNPVAGLAFCACGMLPGGYERDELGGIL